MFLHLMTNQEADGKPLSMDAFCTRYGLARSRVRHWRDRLEDDLLLHGKRGRPRAIDAEGMDEICGEMKRRRTEKNPPDEAAMVSIITAAVHATGGRRKVVAEDPSLSTIQRTKDSLKVTLRKPQVITKARFEACSDPRMSYTVWIMVDAMTKFMPPELFWNWDATQFVVGQSDSSKKVFSIKLDEGNTKDKPLSIVGEESLDIGIKWMFMGSAAGVSAPVVLLLAVDSLGVEDFEVFKIPGLAATVGSKDVGYICFCHSRAGNSKFFKWFIENVAIDCVEQSRTLHGMEMGPNGEIPMSFITSDGEQIVLDAALSKSVRDTLHKKNIHLGKYPASCSGIHQPADVSPIFRACKTRLKNLLSKSLAHQNATVANHITAALNRIETKYKLVIPNGQKSKVVFGCQAVVAAIQDIIRPQFIRRGFADCGQYPPDLTKIMKQSYTEITPAQLKAMMESTAADEAFFLEHGHLTEAQMDRSGVPAVDKHRNVPRDEGPLHHQRSVLLTHQGTVLRQQNYLNNGLALGDIVMDANVPKDQLKELKAAVKLVGNLQKQQKKSQEEKARKASMNSEEIAEEKRQKAIAAEAKKVKKKAATEEAEKLIAKFGGILS